VRCNGKIYGKGPSNIQQDSICVHPGERNTKEPFSRASIKVNRILLGLGKKEKFPIHEGIVEGLPTR